MDKIVLAYSGGLDTSVAVPWLKETYGAEVVCVTMDVGQGKDLESIRERALSAGAARAHVLDVREEFATQYALPALQAGAIYEGAYPLATALGRPLIAKKLIDIARIEGAGTIAHGCSGKGNDQVRIDISARALMPGCRVIAPAREWRMSRAERIEYARAHHVPIPALSDKPYNVDVNLWGRSVGCGELEDPWVEPPAGIFTLTRPPAECPDEPAYLDVQFERGVPAAINGVSMAFSELIASIGTMAGVHGVGRIDMIENRIVGIKTREIYEAPAATVLHLAHRELENFVSPRDLFRMKQEMALKYADMVYNGQWYSPVREAMDAFIAKVQERVTGTIRVKLFKGSVQVVGRTSPNALYDYALATYTGDDAFDHQAALGYIKITGLPIETVARHWGLAEGPPVPKQKKAQ